MSFCKYCGAELAGEDNYCSKCGKPAAKTGSRRPGTVLLITGAAAGAVSALMVGYILTFVALRVLVAISARGLLDPQGLAVLEPFISRIAGLEYVSAHHVALHGFGRNGIFLTLLMPVRLSTFVPIAAMLFGGWLSAGISRPMGKRDALAASFASAILYVLLLLYLRPVFSVNAAVLNAVEFAGFRSAFPSVTLAASATSLILDAGLLSLFLFFLGNLSSISRTNWYSVRQFLAGRGYLPAWASGAVLAFVVGQIVLMLLLLVGDGVWFMRGGGPGALAVFLLIPSAAGLGYYFVHAIPVSYVSSASFGGSAASHVYGVSLSCGIRELMRFPGEPWKVLSSHAISPVVWAAVLIPAGALAVAAFVTYRSRERSEGPVSFSMKLAVVYALLLLIFISFCSFHMNAADIAPGLQGISRASASIVPSTWPTLAAGLVAGFAFSMVGCFVSRRRGRPIQEAEALE